MINEIIVVEGKGDTAAIWRAVQAETIETGGSAIGADVIRRVALAQKRRGVIILTDPDHAGERIRKVIAAAVPGCRHAFLAQSDAEHRGDIGVENASPEAIRDALANVKTPFVAMETQIQRDDLLQAGLINHPMAAKRRLILGEILGIGYANGKQFYKRCQSFQITKSEFRAGLMKMEEKDHS